MPGMCLSPCYKGISNLLTKGKGMNQHEHKSSAILKLVFSGPSNKNILKYFPHLLFISTLLIRVSASL